MKKTISKLPLKQETVRRLATAELLRAAGGDIKKPACITADPISGCPQ